jgi:hypothetical protein
MLPFPNIFEQIPGKNPFGGHRNVVNAVDFFKTSGYFAGLIAYRYCNTTDYTFDSRPDHMLTRSKKHVSLHDTHVSLHDTHVSLSDTHVSLNDTHVSLPDTHVSLSDTHVSLCDTHVSLHDTHVSLSDTHVSLSDTHVSLNVTHDSLPEKDTSVTINKGSLGCHKIDCRCIPFKSYTRLDRIRSIGTPSE